MKPAFIPPDLNIEPELPENITEWLHNNRKRERSILTANAFRIDFHNGEDLYGIDLCIAALYDLINHHNQKNVCLIFIITTLSKSEQKFEEYQALIKEKNLSGHLLLTNENLSFVKLIKECDIVLRPTCTDGDALTVREAIYMDKPIIASDVIFRPEGTILFNNRNHKDLAIKIKTALEGLNKKSDIHETLSKYKEFYLNTYLT